MRWHSFNKGGIWSFHCPVQVIKNHQVISCFRLLHVLALRDRICLLDMDAWDSVSVQEGRLADIQNCCDDRQKRLCNQMMLRSLMPLCWSQHSCVVRTCNGIGCGDVLLDDMMIYDIILRIYDYNYMICVCVCNYNIMILSILLYCLHCNCFAMGANWLQQTSKVRSLAESWEMSSRTKTDPTGVTTVHRRFVWGPKSAQVF